MFTLSVYPYMVSCLIQQNKTNMKKKIIQVFFIVLSIQVQFLFGEQGNIPFIFREQGSKRKIILRNKAIYFRETGADLSGEQRNRYPLGGPP